MAEISLKDYLTASGKYPERETHAELTAEKIENAYRLLTVVNAFLADLGVNNVTVSSGFRPSAANSAAGGAKKSLHMQCLAIDIVDQSGNLDKLIESRNEVKKIYGIWQEDPVSTVGWAHLDIKDRGNRKFNTFLP